MPDRRERRRLLQGVRKRGPGPAARFGDPPPQAVRHHVLILHHGLRSGIRPEISATRAAIAAVIAPVPPPGPARRKAWAGTGSRFSGATSTRAISSRVMAWRPPSPPRLTTRRLQRVGSPSPSVSRSRTVSRTERSVWSATITRTSAMSRARRYGAAGIRGTSAIT